MPVRFHRSAMLDRTEARILAAAIRDGIGERDELFLVSIFVLMDRQGYEILIDPPEGETVRITCSGPSEMLPASIRNAVRRALADSLTP